MNKKIMFLVLFFAFSIAAKAQVFILDEEFEGEERLGYQEFELITPYQGTDDDEFAPIGDGLLALTGLAGAYLIAKRKKKQ